MTVQLIQSPNAQVTLAPASKEATSTASSATQPAVAASTSGTKTASTSPSSASYTVNISNAARVALAEFAETSVQTTQEANHGDHQAQRLLAKEQAVKAG